MEGGVNLRVMQWNLLATGLHDDGFVQGNMFGDGNTPALVEHLRVTKEYRSRLLAPEKADVLAAQAAFQGGKVSAAAGDADAVAVGGGSKSGSSSSKGGVTVVDLDLAKTMQNMLSLLVFGEAVPVNELLDVLQRGADLFHERFSRVPESVFYSFKEPGPRAAPRIAENQELWNEYWRPMAEFFQIGLSSNLVEDSIETLWKNKLAKSSKIIHPYAFLSRACDFLRETFFLGGSAATDAASGTGSSKQVRGKRSSKQGSSRDVGIINMLDNELSDMENAVSSPEDQILKTGSDLLRQYRKAFGAQMIDLAIPDYDQEPPRKTRHGRMLRVVSANAPDLLCLEEVAPDQFLHILRMHDHCFAPTWLTAAAYRDLVAKYTSVSEKDKKNTAILNGIFEKCAYRVKKTGPAVNGLALLAHRKRLCVQRFRDVTDEKHGLIGLVGLVVPARKEAITVVVDGDQRPPTLSPVSESEEEPLSPKKKGPANKGTIFQVEGPTSAGDTLPLHAPDGFVTGVAHLKSGAEASDAQARGEQIRILQTEFERYAATYDLVLGMDGNYDQALVGFNYAGDAEGTSGGWQSLQKFGMVNYLESLKNEQRYGRRREVCGDDGVFSKKDQLHAVTVNKMRGMFSAQVKKWGAYQLRNIDYVMSRRAGALTNTEVNAHTPSVTRPAQISLEPEEVVNAQDLMVFERAEILHRLTEDTSIEEIMKLNETAPREFVSQLLPSDRIPSDHLPVVVQFKVEIADTPEMLEGLLDANPLLSMKHQYDIDEESDASFGGGSCWWCCRRNGRR
ncbi:unnamed protein product [Amoebophrya sp. A25]|nr:unnamed protein product [Amoebophrya sp. A25]|eukprot:GSA25T00021612001.1